MKKLILAALLAAPLVVLAKEEKPSERQQQIVPPELQRYTQQPKYAQSYEPGASAFFARLVMGCMQPGTGEIPGNMPACLCTAWTLMERHSLDDLKKLGVEKAGKVLDAYAAECAARHPLKK